MMEWKVLKFYLATAGCFLWTLLFAFFCWTRGQDLLVMNETPVSLSARELVQRGASGPPNVRITDFRITSEPAISVTSFYNKNTRRTETSNFAYYCLLSTQADGPTQAPIIVSMQFRNPGELAVFAGQTTQQGMVRSRSGIHATPWDSLNSEVQQKLIASNPGVDFTKAIVMEAGDRVGKERVDFYIALACLFAGILGTLIFGLIAVYQRRQANTPVAAEPDNSVLRIEQ
ncbi:MAG: hypothetical protein JNM56_11510 [Planctomycetia bacterium]|nr:hypothetical protein [Planctomycetia bacterium]